MKMSQICRRTAIALLSSVALAACSQAGGDGEANTASTAGAALQDMSLGAPDAPITMVEYASWTCGACGQFHRDAIPTLKSEYVETGKVRLVFREFPTAPANISIAGFAIARCAGPDAYFDVIEELFERQTGILAVARQGGQVREALRQIASNHGIAQEEDFDACLQDQDIRRAIGASVALGDAQGVSATPTVYVNGEKLQGGEWRYADGLRSVLDTAYAEATGTSEETKPQEQLDEAEAAIDELNGEIEEVSTEVGQSVDEADQTAPDFEAAPTDGQ